MFKIYDEPDSPVPKPYNVASKHMTLFETHLANIVFANGGCPSAF